MKKSDAKSGTLLFLTALCVLTTLFLAGCSRHGQGAAGAPTQTRESDGSGIAASLSGDLIGPDEAENAALAHAGLSASEVTFTKTKLDYDNGRAEYEIEFITDTDQYEYDVSATDGSVLEFSRETRFFGVPGPGETGPKQPGTEPEQSAETQTSAGTQTPTQSPPVSQSTTKAPEPPAATTGQQGNITLEDAKNAALAHAGLSASEVSFTETKFDDDDGRAEYEIEFICGTDEYEYEIDARNGAVLKYSKETASGDTQGIITLDDAKKIALAYAGLSASEVRFTKAELDDDDGRLEYEIEFYLGRKEYEFTIDPMSGEILEAEIDG